MLDAVRRKLSAKTDPSPASEGPDGRVLERKIRWSRAALLLETLWPRLWLLFGLAALFVLVSLAGVWPTLPELAHKVVLALFALAALAVGAIIARTPAPTRAEALARMEARSGVPHRPATAYDDTLTINAADPSTGALWQAHRSRLARLIDTLKPARPEPRTDKRDPFAFRALALLCVIVLGVALGDGFADRLWSAFRFGPLTKTIDARLDAWVTPPAYTGKPPVMLADGARPGSADEVAAKGPLELPERSVLVARGSGSLGPLALELIEPGQPAKKLDAPASDGATPGTRARAATTSTSAASGSAVAADASEIGEVKAELRKSGTVRLIAGGRTVASWPVTIIPDNPPTVALAKEPERTLRGALRIPYKAEDDYGIASLEARLLRPERKADTSRTAWARAETGATKGPRPPYERPPTLTLRLNQSDPKQATGTSLHELGDHLWAGLPVRLELIAKDLAGQTGRSLPYSMILPPREFRKPLARAVVEQRRKLIDDPRRRAQVLKAIDYLTMEPDGFLPGLNVFTNLRSTWHLLNRDGKRATRNEVAKRLWQIALRIEDGSLTDAERRLRELQDQLSQALRDGASDEEMQRLMQELRQAMNEFLQELQRQAQNMPPMDPNQMSSQNQMSQRDLDQMMRNLEDMMRSGNRDMAQQMLSELRDLLERLQSGQMAQGQPQQGQGQSQMNQMMNELGELLGRQQQLLDDTFRQGQQGQEGQQGQQGQRGQQGQQGQRGQQGQGGQQGQQGQRGQGQQGQRGQGRGQQQGEPGGEGRGQADGGRGGEGLGQRQGELREMLERLERGMGGMGMQAPGQFGEAGRAMEEAQRMLRQGDLDGAAEAEGRALDQLRQGARQMAQDMMRQQQQRQGQQNGPGPFGDPSQIDPLGRAQAPTADGFDPGVLTKIPDQIDAQRAREILEELRKRFGEQNRPAIELEYLERLLKRF